MSWDDPNSNPKQDIKIFVRSQRDKEPDMSLEETSNDLPNPEEHPDEVFIICLHDGEGLPEYAESECSWIVNTKEEIVLVTSVLDSLISKDMDLEEATWTLVRVKKNQEISRKAVVDDLSDYLERKW